MLSFRSGSCRPFEWPSGNLHGSNASEATDLWLRFKVGQPQINEEIWRVSSHLGTFRCCDFRDVYRNPDLWYLHSIESHWVYCWILLVYRCILHAARKKHRCRTLPPALGAVLLLAGDVPAQEASGIASCGSESVKSTPQNHHGDKIKTYKNIYCYEVSDLWLKNTSKVSPDYILSRFLRLS